MWNEKVFYTDSPVHVTVVLDLSLASTYIIKLYIFRGLVQGRSEFGRCS